eukprot:767491-Hanusia_phi.AAC.9
MDVHAPVKKTVRPAFKGSSRHPLLVRRGGPAVKQLAQSSHGVYADGVTVKARGAAAGSAAMITVPARPLHFGRPKLEHQPSEPLVCLSSLHCGRYQADGLLHADTLRLPPCQGPSLIVKGLAPSMAVPGMVARTREAVYGDPIISVFHRLRARLFRSYRARLGLAALFAGASRYRALLSRSVRPLPWSYFSLLVFSGGSIGSV